MAKEDETLSDVWRVVVLPDIHVPNHDRKAVRAVLNYIGDGIWDEIVLLGDFLDLSCISFHNKGKPRLVEGTRLEDDYAEGRRLLDLLEKEARRGNPDCRITLLEGNHEFRIERLIDENPQLEGLLEVSEGLELEERRIRWIRCYKNGSLYRIGNCYFHHGLYTNKYHAAKMVDNYGVNIVYGHCHDTSCFPKTIWGRDKTIIGQSLGTLALYDQDYMAKRPANWQHAFGVFFFRKTGEFNHFVVNVTKGQFVAPNGKIYAWDQKSPVADKPSEKYASGLVLG